MTALAPLSPSHSSLTVMPGNGCLGAISSVCTQVYPGAFGPNCEMSPLDLLTLLRNHIRARPISTIADRPTEIPSFKYLLASGYHRCYPCFMTVFRHDYALLTGMPASTVALSCAGTTNAIAAVWTMQERRSSRQPSCFRLSSQPSTTSVGLRPGRRQGPDENSHKYLSVAVRPARNAA